MNAVRKLMDQLFLDRWDVIGGPAHCKGLVTSMELLIAKYTGLHWKVVRYPGAERERERLEKSHRLQFVLVFHSMDMRESQNFVLSKPSFGVACGCGLWFVTICWMTRGL